MCVDTDHKTVIVAVKTNRMRKKKDNNTEENLFSWEQKDMGQKNTSDHSETKQTRQMTTATV